MKQQKSMKADLKKARVVWKYLWPYFQIVLLGGKEPNDIFKKSIMYHFLKDKRYVPIRAQIRMNQYLARRRRREALRRRKE